jgi:hypothetical protein
MGDFLRYTGPRLDMKFIEANWGLSPITARSLDDLPNSIAPFKRIPLITLG